MRTGLIIPGEEYFLFRNVNQRSRSSRKTRSLQLSRISHEPEVSRGRGPILWIEQQVAKKRVKRDYQQRLRRGRPVMSYKRFLKNRAEITGNSKMDHNVKEAWDLGYTGRGVVVTILDDGLERTHPDIAPNYDARASYDVNDRDDDPMPRYEYSDENRHGTRCAGEVAAIFNNSLCIVGIAYNARIGGVSVDVTLLMFYNRLKFDCSGIRMLDGDVTDAVEAASLGHNSDYVDIYSASWGPDDDGRTVDGPAKLTRAAFERGIREGRRGKGSVFVWASGNGGKDADSCNCDGYTNSTYSSGATGEKMIVTTDLHHACTNTHTGTSASAPLAAGIVALTLEANPDLTWRDLQHIVIRAAKPINLRAGDWVTNGVGRNVTIPHGNRLQLQLYTDGCAGSPDEQVVYLEHVQAIITLKAPKRGDIQIYLTSPSGTRSTLLTKRARDTSRAGFIEWAFMTTHSWGELAAGLWTLEVDNDGWDDAELVKWDLVMFGTVDETTQYGGGHNSALTARSLAHIEEVRKGTATSTLWRLVASLSLPMLVLLLRL
ncbi:convertase P-domain protein [Ancylostoma ceylanicum]|uniref:Convertase P-domain protein n=1 Tax=Ancylostoma ceylanicum TaxID=53326 RepID=A0A0D6M527_9BILA|nr:convertase P-domain protein [Ancylostoma ceylanicum]